jgi:3-phenylpropionate/cinnamic acid dioxygenase small subunit
MAAGTWESHHAITTLMFQYADCVDRGDFDGIGRLFTHGRITQSGGGPPTVGADAVTALYHHTTKIHPDGTTRTRHINANLQIDIDEDGDSATAQSVFVVFQASERVPLQPVVTGRYRDRFERVGGVWQWAEREMQVEHLGELRDHLTEPILKMLGVS